MNLDDSAKVSEHTPKTRLQSASKARTRSSPSTIKTPTRMRLDVTYSRVVCKVRPQKADPNCTRITIGGKRICYPHDTGTKTGSLEVVKLQLNNVLSTKDARFVCYDLENFYLGTPL